MKKIYALIALLALTLSVSLTSCDDDYYYTTVDPDLVGYWELTQYNGRPVTGYDTNYFEFFSNGNGIYYYYDRGTPYQMNISYDVDYGSRLYIYYADGSSSQMSYWLRAGGTQLVLQWYTNGYRNQYVYDLVNNFYWPAPQRRQVPAVITPQIEGEFTSLFAPGLDRALTNPEEK